MYYIYVCIYKHIYIYDIYIYTVYIYVYRPSNHVHEYDQVFLKVGRSVFRSNSRSCTTDKMKLI